MHMRVNRFGAQSGWYFEHLAGLKQAHASKNWHTIIVDPYVNATLFNLTSIAASVETYKGAAAARWSSDVGAGGTCAANVAENSNAMLKCSGGGTIARVVFASYGTPTGSCGSFKASSCNSNNSARVVSEACVGKASCSVPASNGEFGYDPCVDVLKHLDVQVECSDQATGYFEVEATVPSGSTGMVFLRRSEEMVADGNPPIAKWVVQEGGKTVWKEMMFSNGDDGVVAGEAVGDDALMFTVQSGSYSFVLSA